MVDFVFLSIKVFPPPDTNWEWNSQEVADQAALTEEVGVRTVIEDPIVIEVIVRPLAVPNFVLLCPVYRPVGHGKT